MFRKLFDSNKRFFGLRPGDWLCIVAAFSVYIGITLWNITKSSIWFDEAFGSYLIRFNYLDIARYTATDVHPPLYYWALKTWTLFFGNTEIGMRSMSVFFGCIAIIFGYLLVARLFNRKAARFSLVFMVLAPMFVRYGQEARMYTMVVAIALMATYTLTIAMRTKKKLPWIIYGILVGAGMLTHYFSAIIWITHWLWRADVVRRISKKGQFVKNYFSTEWIQAHLAAFTVFVFWIPFFAVQLFIVQAFGFWIPPINPGTLGNFLTNVVYYLDINQATGWLAVGFILLVAVMVILSYRVYRSLSEEKREGYRLIIMLAFVPMLLLFVLSVKPLRSVFIDRYLITSALFISMFIGVTLAMGGKFLSKKLRIIVPILAIGLMGYGIYNVYDLGNYNKNTQTSNNTRQMIQLVSSKSSTGEPIIAATPWLFYEASVYNSNEHPIYFIDPVIYKFGSLDMLKYSDNYKIKDIQEFARQHKTFWYVEDRGTLKQNDPTTNLRKVKEVLINDSVSGEPAYRGIEYQYK